MNNPEKVKSLMKTVIDRLTGTKEAIDYAAVNKVLDNIEVAKLLKVFVSEGISKEDLDELNHLVDAVEPTQNMFTDYSKSVAMLESLRNVSDANVLSMKL